jgi:hypothetical protein
VLEQEANVRAGASEENSHSMLRSGWPSLPAVHALFAQEDHKSIEPLLTTSNGDLPFEAALLLSRIQALRGEYELAEEMLVRSGAEQSPIERAAAERELIHDRIGRGDVSQAHQLLSSLVLESPKNEALLKLTAEIDIEHNHRIRQEAEDLLP